MVATGTESSPIDFKLEGFNIDANNQGGTVDAQGSKVFIGIYLKYVGNEISDDGIYSCTINNFNDYWGDWGNSTWQGNYGIRAQDVMIEIDDNLIYDNTSEGIFISGASSIVKITNNELDGTYSRNCGIDVVDGATIEEVSGNNIYNFKNIINLKSKFKPGNIYYDKSCTQGECFTALSRNVEGVFKNFSKKKI